jgi:hypothetical protein
MAHPFIKMDPVTKEFVESAIYNQETGEKMLCWPIDAKEIMAANPGLWLPTPPPEGSFKPASESTSPEAGPFVAEEPVAVEEPAAEEKDAASTPTRRGRPPKH